MLHSLGYAIGVTAAFVWGFLEGSWWRYRKDRREDDDA